MGRLDRNFSFYQKAVALERELVHKCAPFFTYEKSYQY